MQYARFIGVCSSTAVASSGILARPPRSLDRPFRHHPVLTKYLADVLAPGTGFFTGQEAVAS